jgi:hypothetical protein
VPPDAVAVGGDGARRATEAAGLDPGAAVARALGVCVRRVALRGEWWRRDSGPLVGELEEGRRPGALLRGRLGGSSSRTA